MTTAPQRRIMYAPDGTTVTDRTSTGYDVAGLVQDSGGRWKIVARGRCWATIYDRTHGIYNQDSSNKAMHVGSPAEQAGEPT